MRSRSNSLENSVRRKRSQHHVHSRHRKSEQESQIEETAGAKWTAGEHDAFQNTGTILRNHKKRLPQDHKTRGITAGKGKDLSRDDLLFLLSMLEGELQARDEIITVLKAEKIDLALLEARYGFVTPPKVLQALQRDAIQGKTIEWQEDIYEKPVAELDKVAEKQKETHRRMLEQLLLVEKSHRQTIYKLEDEKKKHSEYMKKSDEFTNLLEQERERLKLLIDQEKNHGAWREKENNKKVSKLKEELTKLKTFALLVVDEQQRVSEQLVQQSSKVQELTASIREVQENLTSARSELHKEEQKVLPLEAKLQHQSHHFHQEQEVMTAKLTNEDAQNRQLRQKLSTLTRHIDELEETNKTLRKAEEELQDLRDKINRGECGNSNLMAEVEDLRKRVMEMEGKDEELIKMEDQCRDLNKKLEKDSTHSQNLKSEVDKLNRRIMELEKLEDAFSKSKQECCSLKCSLEKERTITKQLSNELESLKERIRELEAIEVHLENTEMSLKEDLSKLKTLTVMLVDERNTMTEKLKETEEKLNSVTDKLQVEQDKVTLVTEKLIEESKKSLKSKADLEEKLYNANKDREELKAKLKTEDEKNNDLQCKLNMMKRKLQSLEAIEKEFLRNKARQDGKVSCAAFLQEDNKVKDLTKEVEHLRQKLSEMKVVENDLLRTEDEFESLERKYASEQNRAKTLMEELEASKKELCKYKMVEKEESSQEQILYKRLKEEEAKSSHLTREVEALKDKIHEYMTTEDSICQVKSDHAVLQRKLTQQENKNKELAREMENITKELERYRRFSKSLRPGLNGRRISDLQVSSKEVQTDPVDNEPPDYKTLAHTEKAIVNGKLYDENDSEEEINHNKQSLTKYTPTAVNNVNNLNNNRMSKVSWGKNKDGQNILNGKGKPRQNGNHVHPADLVLTHTPGQPLHIKVTPDHGHNTAMLEITSPTSENSPSYTSTAVIPNCSGGLSKQRITIIQNAALSPPGKSKASPTSDGLCSPERTMSPLTMATYSRTMTPDSCGSISPDRAMSPIQIVAVTTSSPERSLSTEHVEMSSRNAVFRVTPERQHSWQLQRSNSTGPSVITTEDNKIHIHLGSPYVQTNTSRPMSPSYISGQENRTPVLTNGMPIKSANKITSSITITPATSPILRPSQITILPEAFRHPGPTRIPKPKACTTSKGPSTTINTAFSKSQDTSASQSGKSMKTLPTKLNISQAGKM
ncbi:LOW QUALITY PROTEIN: filamin A-interacting protein 1-like [Erpetoichthys calabaricus]|uniref:LOW QUALITY PROTEIN: filamin A-interacting protein 1-like n=1 Tax=Erpetoichthys calabaricus TaxID=27687 RepID=UPI0022347309|nr:LOW QUALITY PROTEIN: filamin A-interacting protein 1-like [Erpetoichthys calabaricus]